MTKKFCYICTLKPNNYENNFFTFLCMLCILPLNLSAEQTGTAQFTIEVSNQWNKDKTDEPVVIRLNEINPSFHVRSAVVMDGKRKSPRNWMT